MTETKEAVNSTSPAYTLVELLAVVTIIVLLAVLTVPALMPMFRRRALAQGAMQMKAALLQSRTSAIMQESDRIAVMPINLRSQPPQWVVPTKMSEWFGHERWVGGTDMDLSYPRYWNSGSWDIKYVHATPVDDLDEDGGMFETCWTGGSAAGALVYGFYDADDGEPDDSTDYRKKVNDGDILGMWVYLGSAITGVGFSVQAEDSDTTNDSWTATAYWGTGIAQDGATEFIDKGGLPQKNKWVHLAASTRELGVGDGQYLCGIKFRQYVETGSDSVYWDKVVIWKNVFRLPDFIVPDLTQFPIDFEKDGRLKATRVTTEYVAGWKPVERDTHGKYWFDRMIILKDVRDRQLQQYLDSYDVADGDGDGFWECEPFVDEDDDGWWTSGEDYDDWGLDRVRGTSDSGDDDSDWDFEGEVGGMSDEAAPSGQVYIKVNKITGVAKVCAHPGG